jgi:dTDP-4-amino-4,6-dideoxygalactose transaminase
LFVIRHPRRDALRAYLHDRGIGSDIHYPTPPHRQKAYLELAPLSFPLAEAIHREVLSLPLNPTLTNDEVAYIADVINQFT